MNAFIRTAAIFAGLALPLIPVAAQEAGQAAPQNADAIATAIAAPSRTPANIARDIHRHPAETLRFFGVTPGQAIVEFSPGGGWYTEILAPLLRERGTLYALQNSTYLDRYRGFLATRPDVYDKVKLVPYAGEPTPIPAGSADTVLTFRNIHNMVMAGTEAATFKTFFDILKPGGTLGIVDHRLPEDRDSALEKTSGYLKVSTVRRIAEAAGFEYVDSSEINANPRDTADWEKGVWTLPPTLRHGEVDRDKYVAIGESDRMTLKFRKPAQ